MSREQERIDFVMPWVDGADPAWLAELHKYAPEDALGAADERFRDWDNLRYWFRGVEKFAPWVGMIHFITWGHLPKWLNTAHPKLHVVRHEDYIPPKYLPCFSSHPIELNMHRIRGLAEQFVYFNDDFFLLRDVAPGDFFAGGLPCDMLAFQPVVANPANPLMSHIYLNNTLALCRHFDKRDNVRKQPGSYFKIGYPPLYFFYNLLELAFPLYTGFYTVHGPSPYLKSTFDEVWAKEGELLDRTCCHRFRDKQDVSQYLMREWQKLAGRFRAKNIVRDFGYFNVESQNHKLVDTIIKRKKKMICANDANQPIDFEHAKAELNAALEQILPEKSAYEN